MKTRVILAALGGWYVSVAPGVAISRFSLCGHILHCADQYNAVPVQRLVDSVQRFSYSWLGCDGNFKRKGPVGWIHPSRYHSNMHSLHRCGCSRLEVNVTSGLPRIAFRGLGLRFAAWSGDVQHK